MLPRVQLSHFPGVGIEVWYCFLLKKIFNELYEATLQTIHPSLKTLDTHQPMMMPTFYFSNLIHKCLPKLG